VSDFLDDRRKEITDRVKELKPVVDEFNRLEAAAVALAGVIGSAASEAGSVAVATVTRRRGPGRPRGSSSRKKAAKAAAAAAPKVATPGVERKKPGRPKGSGKKVGRPPGSGKKVGRPKGKAGRRKGSGQRATQALSLVRGQPGITIPELAVKMGIKQNYLYRVLPGLEQEGKLEKRGRGWYPKGAWGPAVLAVTPVTIGCVEMPRRNIELKASDPDPDRSLRVSLEIGASDEGWLHQTDTYFRVLHGRLKLREEGPVAQLISYERSDETVARESRYRLAPSVTPPGW
jgi:hypothetical protein